MKKTTNLLLIVCMFVLSVVCLVGCKKTEAPTQTKAKPTEPKASTTEPVSPINVGEEKFIDFLADETEEEERHVQPVNFEADAPVAGATYTYNVATSMLPKTWNIHTYQENTSTTVLDYTEDALYTFEYNSELNGYQIVPAMAKDFAVDVTEEYAEEWNLDGESGLAYKIELRDDLKFDNGDPINVQDFVNSVELLLNPAANNYRADSLWSGNLKIVNAERYFKGGKETAEDATKEYSGWEFNDDTRNMEVTITNEQKAGLTFDINGAVSYVGSYLHDQAQSWFDAGRDGARVIVEGFGAANPIYAEEEDGGVAKSEEDIRKLDGKTMAEIYASEELLAVLEYLCYDFWCTDPDEIFGFFTYQYTWPELDFEEVGFFADEDGNLVIILDQALKGFYLYYSLCTSFYLVDTDLYESCIDTSAGAYTNSYGTSVATYRGFGPYKLTEFVDDNVIKFEKNPYWYGYSIEGNENFYWTTNIEIIQVETEAARLELFLQGKTDSYGLQADDMADYQSSPYTYFTDGDSTWFIALNPNESSLATAETNATALTTGNAVVKRIICIKEFRQALSFSVDRAAYALALDPLGGTAKALYGNMIISDPENGVAYRTTEQAKDVILKFWGLEDEVGGLYETKDEAIASITGFDPQGAKHKFDEAYDLAVAAGYIPAGDAWEVQIMIGQPGSGSSAYYNNGYEFLKKVWTDAVVGTKLEGHLTFKQSEPLGNNYSDALKQNRVDVLFGVGWTGSSLDPYGLMEAYVAPSYQYDPAWDTTKTYCDVEIGGFVLRASVYDWGVTALNGTEIKAYVVVDGKQTNDYVCISCGTECKPEIRLQVLAAVEGAVLEQYDMIPVNLDSSANLKGMQIKYGTEEYVFGMGRGGIKYMTYHYTDAEWETFVAEHNNELNYK